MYEFPTPFRSGIAGGLVTTKPTGQGTGLGLSMSYDIVTKGHGEVPIAIGMKVETKEGVGTSFTIVMPIA